MHRHAFATLLAVGALAASSYADCPATPDTVYLQRITSYTSSFRVQDDANAQVVAKDIPLDSLLSVGPVAGDTLRHILMFASPCAEGTIESSTIGLAIAFDSTFLKQGQKRTIVAGRIEDSTRKIQMSLGTTLTGVGTYATLFRLSTPVVEAWIGSASETSPLLAYTRHKKVAYTFHVGDSIKMGRMNWGAETLPDSAKIFTGAKTPTDYQDFKDAVLSGQYDSARVQWQVLAYEYGYAPPSKPYSTSISRGPRAAQPASSIAISRRLDGSWLIAGPKAAPVSIRTLNGRLVRELPAGNSVVWDGLDRAGRPVQAGVYLVEVRGVGHSRIPLAR